MFSKVSSTPRRAFSKVYKNYVNGQWVASAGTPTFPVINPATQDLIGKVPQSTEQEFNDAVANASDTFKEWKEVAIPHKVRFMLKYQELLKQHSMDIQKLITEEHGKSLSDAAGDVFRGYEVVEHAASFNSLAMGESVENVARNVDIYSYRVPLGVCAGIAPFNFPAMVPLWMFPLSITLGNTYILKPSEKVPGATEVLIDLLEQSGVPKGVVNVVHGGPQTVTQICTHPDIKAVSFVGGNGAGEYIYETASKHGKRAQVNMGAKNHGVVMPDAHKDDALNGLIGATFGSAGQRCMALSVAVFVGDSQQWIPELVERSRTLTTGVGTENKDVCPMITKASLERAHNIIAQAESQGSTILLDGRNPNVPGYENGNFLAPTIIDNSNPGNISYDEEIFAPVMSIVRVDTLDEAIDLINSHPQGNGVAIFTQSGGNARQFQHQIEAGQIGINLPIPVPLPMFSFTGNKKSMWGTSNFYGKGAIQFNTQWKTVTARWKPDDAAAQKMSTAMPTMK